MIYEKKALEKSAGFFKKRYGFIFILTILAVMWVLSSCEFAGPFYISSRVVDARSPSSTTAYGVANAEVTVEGNGIVYRTLTDSSGYWSATVDGSGNYRVEVTKTGWFFPPQTTYVGPFAGFDLDTPGVLLNPANADAITFMAVWDGGTEDLDMHLTFPTGDYSTNSLFPDPYYEGQSNWNTGFGPDASIGREEVYFGDLEYPDGTPEVFLSRDDIDEYGPETITIRGITFSYDDTQSTPITPTTANGLADLFPGSDLLTYRWMGVAEVYLSNIESYTEAIIHCFKTDAGGASGTYLGSFSPPSYVPSASARVIRMHFFLDSDGYEDFMLVSDAEAISGETAIKNLEGADKELEVRGFRGRKAE